MSRLQSFIDLLPTNHAQELLLADEQVPRFRKHHEWHNLPLEKISSQELRQICSSLISETQKKWLQQHNFVSGSTVLDNSIGIRYVISASRNGYLAQIRLLKSQAPTPQELSLPQMVNDVAIRRQGLVIVVAPKEHGKWTTIQSLLQSTADQRSILIQTVENATKYMSTSKKSIFHQIEVQPFQMEESHWQSGFEQADIIALDLGFHENVFSRALDLSESGKLVYVALSGSSIVDVIEKLYYLSPPHRRDNFINRLANQLQVSLGQRLLPSGSDAYVLALEVLLGTPQVKTALRDKDFRGLSEIMSSSGEKTGMRTLNQSLIQHLIRRKIDLKTAFAFSPEPEEMDQLLNKVGI